MNLPYKKKQKQSKTEINCLICKKQLTTSEKFMGEICFNCAIKKVMKEKK